MKQFPRPITYPLPWFLLALSIAVPIASATDLPHIFEDGAVLVAAELNEQFEAVRVDLVALRAELDRREITEDLSITLEGEDVCTGLQVAHSDLEGRRITNGATVTVEIPSGIHACVGSVRVSHPDGQSLHIRGLGNGPDDVVLTFPEGRSGFVVPGPQRTATGVSWPMTEAS